MTPSRTAQVKVQSTGGNYEQETTGKAVVSKLKSAVGIDTLKGKTTAVEVARLHDLRVA